MKALFLYSTLTLVALVTTCLPAHAQQDRTHLGGRPSDMVSLFANVPVGSTAPLMQSGPDGNVSGSFVLPAKTALVVTDLVASVNLTGQPGQTRGGLINQAGTGDLRPYFSFDTSQQGSQDIHLTSGVVWTQVPVAINAPDSSSAVFIHVYGYLVRTN